MVPDRSDKSSIGNADYFMPCSYNARTMCGTLHTLLDAAVLLPHVIALQEANNREKEVRQLSDGILIISEEELPPRSFGAVSCRPSYSFARNPFSAS